MPRLHDSEATERALKEAQARCTKHFVDACAACRKFTELEKEIADTRRTLDALLEKRDQMKATFNAHHDPLAQKLPVEVISRIFTHCRPFPFDHGPVLLADYDRERHLTGTFLLTSICRRWRAIAHNTPNLWTVVSIDGETLGISETTSQIFSWLQRSQGSRLYIRIRMETAHEGIITKLLRKSIVATGQHAIRWTVLDLVVPNAILSWISDAVATKTLNSLKNIKIQFHSQPDPDSNPALTLDASPQYFELVGAPSSLIATNFAHLTTFHMRDTVDAHPMLLTECLQLFRVAFQLRVCSLNGVDNDLSEPLPTPVNAACLRTLDVSNSTATFWKSFSFPCLRELVVLELQSTEAWWSSLQHCLIRSACNLEGLQVYTTDVTLPEGAIDVLKITSSIQRLVIAGVTDQLFALMDVEASPSGSPSTFLNQLQIITCASFTPLDLSWLLIFVNTMKARPDRTFRAFHFQSRVDEIYGGILECNDEDTVRQLEVIARGLDVTIKNHDGLDVLPELYSHYCIEPQP